MTFDSIHTENDLYFITASIVGWIPLFSNIIFMEILLDAFQTRRKLSNILLFAYVIMPTHFHAILKPLDSTIGNVLQNFGSYTSHKIIAQLKTDQNNELLSFFHQNRRDLRSKYSIWQDIQAKNIYSSEFLNQKFEYIHNNPIMKKWSLVADPSDYPYSSAGFYQGEDDQFVELDDLRKYLLG